MNWKEFLKPDWKKIILFILISVFYFFIIVAWQFTGINDMLPLSIIERSSPPISTLNIINLLINLLTYYLISCLIIFGYNKVRKNAR
jgi:hypothetical protein